MKDRREELLRSDKEEILSYVLRNYAGVEVFGVGWGVNWRGLGVVFTKNIEIMKGILEREGEHALKYAKNTSHMKAHICIIKLCCLYCRLCQQAGLSPKSNPLFSSFVELVGANSSP